MADPAHVPPGTRSFDVRPDTSVAPDGQIVLNQRGRKTFVLGSPVTYIGAKTGLEDSGRSAEALEDIRRVTPK